MRRRPRFCSTSSTSCAIWARLWITFARANMDGPGPALHQGPEIHIAVAQGEPHAGWQEGIEDVAFGQQAAQHGLCPQGEFRPEALAKRLHRQKPKGGRMSLGQSRPS